MGAARRCLGVGAALWLGLVFAHPALGSSAPEWSRVELRARKLAITARTTLALQRLDARTVEPMLARAPELEGIAPEAADVLRIDARSAALGTESMLSVWLDPLSGWALQRERVDTVRDGRDKLQRLMERYMPRGDVLDVGCGNGHRLDRWPPECVPFGIELEAQVIPEARARFEARGGRVVHAPAVDGMREFADGAFDGAILRAYLEHEPDPRAVLSALRPKLKKAATAIVKVPNYGCLNRKVRGSRWCGFRFPDHVNYFTPDSLRTMVKSAEVISPSHCCRSAAALSSCDVGLAGMTMR